MKNLILIIGFISLFSVNLSAQWVQTAGPEGGFVTAIASDSSFNIFAGIGSSGFFRSDDQAISWKRGALQNTSIFRFGFSSNSMFVFDGNGGLLRTTDVGFTWTNTSLTQVVTGLVEKGNFLFASTFGGVYRSNDDGVTWALLSNGIPPTFINDITIKGGFLFAGAFSSVYRSQDDGNLWTNVSTGLPSSDVQTIVAAGTKILAGTFNGLYASTNNGTSWNASGLNGLTVSKIVKTATSLFAQTSVGIYRSKNSGASWSAFNTGLPNTSINGIGSNANFVFAGAGAFGVYRLADNGTTWQAENFGLRAVTINNFARIENVIFGSVSGTGVTYSDDNGNNWANVNTGLTSLNVNAITSNFNDEILYAATADAGVFISYDWGGHWTAINNGLTTLNIFSFYINGNQLFAGTRSDGVFKSTNNGAAWTQTNLVGRITGITQNGNAIYAASRNIHGRPRGTVSRSTDGGVTSADLTAGITNNPFSALITKGNYVFASNGDGVFRITNSQTTWTKVITGISDVAVTALYTDGVKIYAGTAGGKVYVSTNNGNSWTSLTQNLPAVSIDCIISNSQRLFTGLNELSVWSSSLPASIISSDSKPHVEVPSQFALYQNYPNPFNPVSKIKYEIPRDAFVKLAVYDMLGKEIGLLVNQQMQAGSYNAVLDGTNLSSGIYFYRITAGSFTDIKKMILVK